MRKHDYLRGLTVAACIVLALVCNDAAAAQRSDSRVVGKITTPDGEPIADAKVVITSVDRGSVIDAVTNSKGEYFKRGLRNGTYVFQVEAAGFLLFKSQVRLSFGTNTVDLQLTPDPGLSEEAIAAAAAVEAAGALNATYTAAFEAYRGGDPAGAIALMREVVAGLAGREEPEVRQMLVSANNVIGACSLELGNTTDAVDAYNAALSIDMESTDAHLGLGESYAKNGGYEVSLQHFKRALEITPDDAAAHYNIGTLLVQSGQTEEAVEILERAIALQPVFPLAYKTLGFAYIRQGDIERAIELLETSLEQETDELAKAEIEQILDALRSES